MSNGSAHSEDQLDEDQTGYVSIKDCIYLLPGHGGLLTRGLGEHLSGRGLTVVGRETVGAFRELSFQDKIERIAKDLLDHFWNEDARVIANSFGGYLFLHAQTLLPPFVGRVLIFSPIVGEFENRESWTSFSPPRPDVLRQLAQAGKYPTPRHCEIHVGENDWQSNPENVQEFAKITGITVSVVSGAGHKLDRSYVATVLDGWLPKVECSSEPSAT